MMQLNCWAAEILHAAIINGKTFEFQIYTNWSPNLANALDAVATRRGDATQREIALFIHVAVIKFKMTIHVSINNNITTSELLS